MLHKFQLLSLSSGEEYRGISVTGTTTVGFCPPLPAAQGRFIFNPPCCEKPVAKLILTAVGEKCESGVNSLKACWWEEILQCSASARWEPGEFPKI